MKTNYRKLSSTLLLGTLLITGSSGYLCYQPIVHADNTEVNVLNTTQTQEINYVDQSTGKVISHQKLTLSKDGKSIANSTKLALPSGYQRTDKFIYDLSAKPGKDNHYELDQNGQVIWNVYVSQNNKEANTTGAKSVTAVNTSDNHDGSVTVTTTTTTATGSKQKVTTDSVDSSSSNLIDTNNSSNADSTSIPKAKHETQASSVLSSSVSSSSNKNADVPTLGTQVSNTSAEAASDSNSTANQAAKPTNNSSSSSFASASTSSSATPNNSSSTSTSAPSSNSQEAQTLPQTSADKATPVIEQNIGLGLAGILAGVGLAHLIKRHQNSNKN